MIVLIRNVLSLLTSHIYYFVGWVRASIGGVRLGVGARVSPRAKVAGAAYIGDAVIATGVSLGKGTYINSGAIHSGVIGDYCSLAYNVTIGPSEHRTDFWTTSPYEVVASGGMANETSVESPAPIIGDGVWIGAHVIILRGVRIGSRSIVAAGSVVTKSIPSYELWGGVPARRIRELPRSNLAVDSIAIAEMECEHV